jgi:hypothetical protein
LVLSLYDNFGTAEHGFFINGVKNGVLGTGLYIPDNHIIAFKGFGTVNGGFVEVKGSVTNSSFELASNDVLNNNTITGRVSSGDNSWGLYLITPQHQALLGLFIYKWFMRHTKILKNLMEDLPLMQTLL